MKVIRGECRSATHLPTLGILLSNKTPIFPLVLENPIGGLCPLLPINSSFLPLIIRTNNGDFGRKTPKGQGIYANWEPMEHPRPIGVFWMDCCAHSRWGRKGPKSLGKSGNWEPSGNNVGSLLSPFSLSLSSPPPPLSRFASNKQTPPIPSRQIIDDPTNLSLSPF